MSLAYLDKHEEEAIQRFLENPRMVEAVKKVLLSGIYQNGTLKPGEVADPTRNFALARLMTSIGSGEKVDKEKIGEDLWICAMGIYIVQDCFRNLESLKKVESKEKEKVNPAR